MGIIYVLVLINDDMGKLITSPGAGFRGVFKKPGQVIDEIIERPEVLFSPDSLMGQNAFGYLFVFFSKTQ